MYQYFQNTLCVEANFLLNELGIPLPTYKSYCQRGKLTVLRRGGNGRSALVEFESIKVDDIKSKIKERMDPKEGAAVSILEKYIEKDFNAAQYFIGFRKTNGKRLDEEKQIEYTTNAIILNAIDTLVIAKKTNMKRITGNKTRLWENISNAVNMLPSDKYPHSLPGNLRSLERSYKRYKKDSYDSLVHKGMDNDNRTKIVGDVADYLLATYCLPNKILIPVLLNMYDKIRKEKGWPSLSETAIQMYLDRPEIKRVWFLARHGKDEYKKVFGHKLSRNRSEWFPNAYWAIDGSKLDWIHYMDNEIGMAAKLKMNPLFDVYSEVILGSSYSETENHTDHFTALKAAVNFSGKRPFKLTYDNQSGHKSKRMQELYDRIIAKPGGIHNPTRPYEKSNPVEQIFNRFQQQNLSMFWFSDKQSIKSKNLNNLPNMDFIKANKHRLMNKEDLLKAWELAVRNWNNAPHPDKSGRTRMEVYNSTETHTQEFELLDMITTFWVDETKEITYRAEGLRMRLAGKEYMFEVLDENEKIDKEFRKFNIGKKFIVRYDPETLDQYIQLMEVDADGKKVFVAYAQPKRQHQEIPILMQDGDKESFFADFSIRDEEIIDVEKEIKDLQHRTGITPEKLIDDQELLIKMGGDLPKEIRNANESKSVFNYL